MQKPTELALQTASRLAERVANRAAPVRPAFIRGEVERNSPASPPLADVLRGGRGGAVRLKVYLSMLWVAAGHPHDTEFPAYIWSSLLDVDAEDPDGRGARRVAEAITWLDRHDLVSVERQPGRQSKVWLRREDASGDTYSIPGAVGERYVQLEPELWTKGWMCVLSGRALGLLLLIKEFRRGDHGPSEFFIAPSIKRAYGLSDDTWTRASRELEETGLVELGRRPVGRGLDQRRWRNVYRFNQATLIRGPL